MFELLGHLNSASGETIGLSIATLSILLCVAFLPKDERRLVRLPSLLLALHLVFEGAEQLLDDGAPAKRIVSVLSVGLLLVTIGRAGMLLVLDVVLSHRLDRPLPKIIKDILQGVVYFVVGLMVLRYIGLEPGQLLTTSALLTAVIGLSLQETLGNLIAGLAVQLQRPFDVGDWIQFDNETKNIGKVVEINWRATKLVTLDEVEVIVPNGLLAKAPLRNYDKPRGYSRRSIYVNVNYDVPPRKVQEIILDAIRGSFGVLEDPPPSVVTNKFGESGVEYWVRFFTDQFHRRDGVDGGVRDRIWYALQRAGVVLSYPHTNVHLQQHSEESRAADLERRIDKRQRALEKVDFLGVIGDVQRRELAERAATRLYSPGEAIVRQGEESDELFILLRGEVSVVVDGDDGPTEIARLRPGQFFGEMALVTGEKRKATVRAVPECEMLVIDHDAFERVLHESPEVVEKLSQILAERQVELDEKLALISAEARESAVKTQSNELLGKIRRFFSMG